MSVEIIIHVQPNSRSVPVETFFGLPPGGMDGQIPYRDTGLASGVYWGDPPGGGGPGGSTNLSATATATTVTINSSTGAGAVIVAATGSAAGLMLPAQVTKLAGVSAGATANQADSYLLNRANHTGTQSQSTIENLTTDLAGIS